MPLFGSKKNKNIDLPEVVDFSNDTWSYKGNPPDYQIQADGFTYDVTDADGNDKNAISLGLSGMLVIVLNAKSPKIKEDEILPPFGKIIKTRNWHSMTVKDANFLVQTAIKKLTNSATSGDVFDLASYAPLEVKRVLLKTLFTISRMQLPPEYREEAEHRIIDDIVPDIFANPEYELALLTGLIVKPDGKASEPVSSRIETSPVLDPVSQFSTNSAVDGTDSGREPLSQPSSEPVPEPDSAFAELQKIYGRKIDTMPRRESNQPSISQGAGNIQSGNAIAEPVQNNNLNDSNPSSERPAFNGAQPNNPFAQNNPSFEQPIFSGAQPNNPFGQNVAPAAQQQPQNYPIPQPANPFENRDPQNIPQPGNPFGNMNRNIPNQNAYNVPQPPMMNNGMVPPANPFAQNPYPNQAVGYPPANPNMGSFQQYPPQMRQPNMPPQQNWNTQNNPPAQFPPQGWMMNQQNVQNQQTPQMNSQWPNSAASQNQGNNPPQGNPNMTNQSPYNPQAPQQAANNN